MTGHQKGCRCERCVFTGTTNNEAYVTDDSARRRFWSLTGTPRVVKVTFEDIRRAYLEALEKEET